MTNNGSGAAESSAYYPAAVCEILQSLHGLSQSNRNTLFRKAQKEHLIIPAEDDYLAGLREFVTQVGRKYGYSQALINAFKLAVDEAASNIIAHAYGDRAGYITIQALIKRRSLTVKLIDQGLYFHPDWAKAPDIQASADAKERPGLGIFVIRKLMDHVDYGKSEAGNELILTKRDPRPHQPFNPKKLLTLPPRTRFRYFVHAVLLVTLSSGAAFTYKYISTKGQTTAVFLKNGKRTAKRIANQVQALQPDLLASDAGLPYLRAILQPIADEQMGLIHSLSVTTTDDTVVWSTIASEIGSIWRPTVKLHLEPHVLLITTVDSVRIYDVSRPLIFARDPHLGNTVHVRLAATYLKRTIAAKRLAYIKYGLIVLGLSYMFLSLLTYLISQPFRRLSRWIQAIRHGENPNDMDFDSSSDIGEIAMAINDLTQKFNQSQKGIVEKDRLMREMDKAQAIQESLLPQKIPSFDSLDIDAYYEAAQSVGGDYYDFLQVDENTLGIAIADVSGKGVPASLMMSIIRTAIRTEARGVKDAAKVLTRVNEFVLNDIRKGLFITVLYAVVDLKTHLVNFANAGHTPLVLHRWRTGKTYYLNSPGFPIGLQLPDEHAFSKQIRSETFQLDEKDTLLFYTDGLTEAMNPHYELFGVERLLKTLRKHARLSLPTFQAKLRNAIYSFKEDGPLHDDITFVLLRPKKLATRKKNQKPTLRLDQHLAVENQYLSVDQIVNVLSVINEHPDYDARDISWQLRSENYNYTEISPEIIAATLHRAGLQHPDMRTKYRTSRENQARYPMLAGLPQLAPNGRVQLRKRFLQPATKETPPAAEPCDEPLVDEEQAEITPEAVDLAPDICEEEKQESSASNAARETCPEGIPMVTSEPDAASMQDADIFQPPAETLESAPPDADTDTSIADEGEEEHPETMDGDESDPITEVIDDAPFTNLKLPETEAEFVLGNFLTEHMGLRQVQREKEEEEEREEPEEFLPNANTDLVPGAQPKGEDEQRQAEPALSEQDISDELIDSIFAQFPGDSKNQEIVLQEPSSAVPPPILERKKKEEKLEQDLIEALEPSETTTGDNLADNDSPGEAPAVSTSSSDPFPDSDEEIEKIERTRSETTETLAGRLSRQKQGEQTGENTPIKGKAETVKPCKSSEAEPPESQSENPDADAGALTLQQQPDQTNFDPHADKDDELRACDTDNRLEVFAPSDGPPPASRFVPRELELEPELENDEFIAAFNFDAFPAIVKTPPEDQDPADIFFDTDLESLLFYDQEQETQAPSDSETSNAGLESKSSPEEPAFSEALCRAIALYKNGNYTQAMRAIADILQDYPDFKEGYAMLGNTLYRLGKIEKALACYKHIQKYYPMKDPLRENLALIYWQTGHIKEAIVEWEEMLRKEPDRINIQQRLTLARKTFEHDTRHVVDVQADGTDKSPHHKERDTKDMDEKLLEKGIAFYRQKNFDAAIEVFENIITVSPTEVEPYQYLGNAYFRNEMLDDAAEVYQKILRIDAQDSTALENLAHIRVWQRLFPQALDEWRKLLDVHPERKDIQEKIAFVSRLVNL